MNTSMSQIQSNESLNIPLQDNSRSGSLETREYCGKDIPLVKASYQVRSNNWDSRQMLCGISREMLTIDSDFIRELEPALWIDVATEYDAENFCRHLDHLQKTDNLQLSDDFQAFEKAWRKDELNHTSGFVYFYALLYELSESEVWRRLESRPVDFEPIKHFFKDEFSICVMLAFDELATTRFYVDHLNRYVAFENPVLLQWIRTVAKDEAMHLANILHVIRNQHKHRLSEVPALLNELAHWDNGGAEYGATFVLDHEGGQLEPEFIARNCQIICKRLGL